MRGEQGKLTKMSVRERIRTSVCERRARKTTTVRERIRTSVRERRGERASEEKQFVRGYECQFASEQGKTVCEKIRSFVRGEESKGARKRGYGRS